MNHDAIGSGVTLAAIIVLDKLGLWAEMLTVVVLFVIYTTVNNLLWKGKCNRSL